MMILWLFTAIFYVFGSLASIKAQLQPPTISLLQPQGIRFVIQDYPGATLAAVHYSINRPLVGSDAGEHNYDINEKTDNAWVHENRNIIVNAGDVVNYWIYVVINGVGQHLTDQSWTAPGRGGSEWNLVFEDNFDTLDTTNKWDYEVTASGGGNWEFQVYTPEQQNTFVRNGNLVIKPTLTADRFGEDFLYNGILDLREMYGRCTDERDYGCRREGRNGMINSIMSGKLKSRQAFRYGRMEFRAKMPTGDWIWPALWLLPRDAVYGGWPRSGEIDVCESRGNENYGSIGVQEFGATLHWGPEPAQNRWTMTQGKRHCPGCTYGQDFHIYRLDWDETGLMVFENGNLVLNVPTPSEGYYNWGGCTGPNPWEGQGTDAPFNREFYLILNVAVGGTNGYFPDNVQSLPYPKPWSNNSPQANEDFWNGRSGWYSTWRGDDVAMEVDYVRVWQRN
ncbi:unnamed protein product [Owenia fusiformis]|uniref:Uncharacterized protein n=1 Tax=Owenia fusiformis TaxID=6347 RepID=A0A8J1TG23_OWEFU|nr:unnamed protein product [Owenia fusiformis]